MSLYARTRILAGLATIAAGAALLLPATAAAREWPAWLVACGAHMRCGTYTAPLDRESPATGTFGLHVVVIPAIHEAAREPDAIVAIEGGPGGASTELATWTQATFFEAAQHRDILLVDQRGTGRSKPLFCPASGLVTGTPSPDRIRAYWVSCLGAAGVDPRLLTTSVAVDDLDDVRAALGYPQVDLYGGSYGATVVQYYLLRHPETVRTAILDGGTLLDVPIFERYAATSQVMLNELFARCRAQAACHRAFPSPARDLDTLLTRLERKPALVNGVTVTRDDFANGVQYLSRQPDTAALLPVVLRKAAKSGLESVLPSLAKLRLPGSDGREMVMSWAIKCIEPWARQDVAETARLGAGTYLGPTMVRSARYAAATCSAMPSLQDVAGASQRVTSTVPGLVVVGSQDPQDPLANVAGVTSVMPNAKVVLVRGGGHGSVNRGCTERLADTFVQRGSAAAIDPRCAAKAPLTPFALTLP
jgi:pimeloyl-ACP methyl ester carboxylesterase